MKDNKEYKEYTCYCKRNFFNSQLSLNDPNVDPNIILFKKGKYYKFTYEKYYKSDYIWVIYNKYGGLVNSGCRFHAKKETGNLSIFSEYFDDDRLMKLLQLENKFPTKNE